jgi:hypothetical protein
MTLHLLQILFTEALTFIGLSAISPLLIRLKVVKSISFSVKIKTVAMRPRKVTPTHSFFNPIQNL